MAPPSTAAGHIVARHLSHGGIAGAVVGSVLGALLIFILVLPFILRAIREHRYHKKIAVENAEMGITGPGYHGGPPGQQFHPLFYQPPQAPGASPGAGDPSAQGPSSDPAATLGDNNSSEDGKPAVSGSSPTPPPGDGAPQQSPEVVGAAFSPATPGDGVKAPPRAAFPQGGYPINTNTAPYAPFHPTLNSAATFPAFGSQDPMIAPRQRSSTMMTARSSSKFSEKLDTIKATFRQGGSSRSSPTRSPTSRSERGGPDSIRSPVEISFNQFDSSNHHTWLMRNQGIDDDSTGVDPSFFEVNTQYLTGASAEYYSGAPLSPPTDPNSHLMSPVSYAAEPPSMIATSLASIASAAAVAGVASGSKKQKPAVSRTDSLKTAATGDDFSPLPLSPTSPLPSVPEGDRGIKPDSEQFDQTSDRGISSPPDGSRSIKTELTPEPTEFMPRSPSHRLVPSPRLPAPGTVNPMDVWAPATEDERFVHKTAELDRIEQSPQPTVESSPGDSLDVSQHVPSISVAASPSDSNFEEFVAEQEEASGPVEASSTLTLPIEPMSPNTEASPDVADAPSPQQPPAVPSVSAPEQTITTAPAHPAVTVPASPASDHSIGDSSAEPQAQDLQQDFQGATTQATQYTQDVANLQASPAIANQLPLDSNIGTGQIGPADFDELMLGLDDGGYNFAYGEGQQMGYIPNNNDFTNINNINNANNVNNANVNANNNGLDNSAGPNNNNNFNTDFNGAATYPIDGAVGGNNMYQTMTQHMPQQPQQGGGQMYWNMQNMQNPNVPAIAGPFMTPVTQGDFPNGLLGAPFTVPSKYGVDGMNNGIDYGKDNGFPQFALQTPQSSPGQVPSNFSANGILPPGTMPMTPSSQKLAPNFNSPLSVPGSNGIPSRPVTPSSNQGSTPGQSSSSPRTFACDDCGRVFDQIHKLNHHKRYHERPHECTVPGCGKRFGTRTHLDRHVNDKHSKSRKYHCTEEGCPYSVPGGKSFPRKDNWRRHMVNKHGVQPDHEPIEVIDQPMMSV